MNIDIAITMLAEHNKWRRGEAPYGDDYKNRMPFSPKDIGIAIDTIVDHFREATKMVLGWQDIARLADIIGHTSNLDKQGQLRPREEYYTEIANNFNEGRSQ